MNVATILVTDDEANIRNHLASYMQSLGHEVETAEDGVGALAAVGRRRFDLVFSDVRMARMDGLKLLAEIVRRAPETTVVLMTAYATVAQAVEAIRVGAYDYLVKPFGLDQVDTVLGRVLELQTLRRENRRLRAAAGESPILTSENRAMQQELDTARRAAPSDAVVLLTGESGTGKTVLARQIHDWSRRANGPFVTIACTTLAEHLLESELFGHVRGAFTGAHKDKAGRVEAAAGGTLFLDEVGELPLELQGKLLRLVEEHCFERVGATTTATVDTRVIAATNRALERDIAAGRFREDLFFRLNVIGIRLPPLRERPEDLDALVDHLLARLAARDRRTALCLAPDARAILHAYAWPGNVRELANALERAAVLTRGDEIEAEDLPDRLHAPPGAATDSATGSLEDLEKRHIERVLAESTTLEEAAARLGIDVTTLWRKRKRYRLDW
ncbi:MAG: sigma-54-dependent Fis family transcriptional regulator [Deltaproteobacteria bacterium]|nr:sigma-54-dependent Fis family transcriptional regulator [Deltaproteobacteria bacterium]